MHIPFHSKINKFQTIGDYDYKFDEVGNVIVDSSSMEFSHNYLSLPLLNLNYDAKKIESFYDVNFTEFSPAIVQDQPPSDILEPVNFELLEENAQLKIKIDELIKLSESDSSIASNEVVKQVILDLRIALKQGIEERDFSTDFPYTPKADE